MDKSFRPQETDIKQPCGFFVNPHIIVRTLHWLTGLFQLTEKEQMDAGIYLGGQG